ncbi:glycosyltransferase, partial [Hydrocoleum sp. CS-953]|uniref:glycosyltransferase n=1 Tax=Hydrocoleum sp. CS-953 TaxID=1671698 RepID=UPI00117B02E2
MNIVLYLKIFPPCGEPLNRGISKAVDGLAFGLTECGNKVTILCEGYQDNFIKTEKGYEIKCFANLSKKGAIFSLASGLKKYIQEKSKPDLVVISGIFNPSAYSLSRFLKKCGIDYIAWPHDPYNPDIFSKKSYLKFPYWYFLERPMLRQAKAVQVLDIRHGEFLINLGVNTSIIELPNGFHPEDVLPESKLEWRQNTPAKLLFLGRIDAYNKGLDLLVEAFAKIVRKKDTSSKYKLIIQGPDFGDRKMLEEKGKKLLICDNLSFLNPDFDVSPTSIIANYDIFCLPSRFEGFGLSALEAMLAGRVLLVSEVGGIASHVKSSGCGVVVQPEVASIKEGLEELLERRSEWEEMGMAGRRYVLKNLQWNKIAERALD